MDETADEETLALERELEELDAASEALTNERAAASRKEALAREVANKRAILAAEKEHGEGKFACIDTDMGVVIVRKPHPMHFRRFSNLEAPQVDDCQRLVLTCLVHPTRAAYEALTEELPAVPMLAASAICDLAAGRRKALAGKS